MSTVAKAPTIVVGGRTLGGNTVVLPIQIQVGRENATAQPDANALSFSYLGALPPEFVRGAPVSATLLGWEEPGWSDIWADLWSVEESTPGLLPTPDMEGFSQWQRFWGFAPDSWPYAVGSAEDGGATLLTTWPDRPPPDQYTYWQGQPFTVGGATDRTIRVSVRVWGGNAAVSYRWDLLWSETNANLDYLQSATFVISGPGTDVAPGGSVYVGWEVTIPDEAQYARLALVLGAPSVPPPPWDAIPPALTWDNVDPTWTWDTYGTPGAVSWDALDPAMTWDSMDQTVTWDDYGG